MSPLLSGNRLYLDFLLTFFLSFLSTSSTYISVEKKQSLVKLYFQTSLNVFVQPGLEKGFGRQLCSGEYVLYSLSVFALFTSFSDRSANALGVFIALSWTDGWGGSTWVDFQWGLVLGGCACDESYLDWQLRMPRIVSTTVTACSSYLDLSCAKTSQDALRFLYNSLFWECG